jgi:hypothetical protein
MASSYRPRPIVVDHVRLNDELLALMERLAEHAHDVWAEQRLLDGWRHGPQRDDAAKLHPCLVPYSHLSEEEKQYDRNAVLGTLRAIVALGFVVSRGAGVSA